MLALKRNIRLWSSSHKSLHPPGTEGTLERVGNLLLFESFGLTALSIRSNAAPYYDLRQQTESSSRGGARTTRGESQGGEKQLDTNDHLRSGAGIYCAKRELR